MLVRTFNTLNFIAGIYLNLENLVYLLGNVLISILVTLRLEFSLLAIYS